MRSSPRRLPPSPVAWLLLLAALLSLGCAHPVAAADRLALQPVRPDLRFTRPVHVAPVPDGSGDLVIVEQRGVVRRVAPGGRSERTYLDLRSRVNDGGNEEGLLSIAFHPRYRENRRLYVYYSASGPRRSVVARFQARADGTGDPVSGEIVLEVGQPYSNHNGGQLAFGPDGMLYVGLGDGGSGGDPQGHGQDRSTLLGSILRIDVERSTPGRGYAIPPDNPFAGAGGDTRAEIWAYGLRNPWRFSFDRETGELYAADVGQNEVEEVDRIVRGGNYGWNVREGTRCFRARGDCASQGLIPPIAEYEHSQGRSITGGFVYRGSAIPALRGRYLFADFVTGRIWSIPAGGDALREPLLELDTDYRISSFGEDESGELFVLDHRGGRLYRLVAFP